jgi:cysteine desulfurase
MKERKIYLDNSATTRIDEDVKKEMDRCFSEFYGNPGSFHSEGLKAKNAIDNARSNIAKVLNCDASEVIFTGSGTESINLALKGLAFGMQGKKKHIITSSVEHKAVLSTCKYLEKKGFEVTYLKVDKYGLVEVSELKKAIRDDTFLVSIIYANNEIGTVQDIKEIGKICKEKGIVFHTDACQAGCYLDLDVAGLNIDLMSLNGSKIYGPKGIGVLYAKKGLTLEPLIHGGGQEKGLRGGTENVQGIVAFAKALEIAVEKKDSENDRLIKLRDKFINGAMERVPNVILNGHPSKRLPNNVNLSFLDVEGESILLYLDDKGVYASTGSACTSTSLDPSHVLVAMGIPFEIAHGSIRFTMGRETTEEDIDYVLEILPGIIENLRKVSPYKTKLEKQDGGLVVKNG